MNTQHTPGPWKTNHNNPNPDSTWVYNSVGQLIAETNCNYHIERKVKAANANLISAAPDLLISLQRLYDATYGKTDLVCPLDFENARKAIAKARGEA